MPNSIKKCPKPNEKQSVSRINKHIVYSPEMFGFSSIGGDGKGVKICIVDSGYPSHRDLPPIDMQKVRDFTQQSSQPKDKHGHATGVAGILASNNSQQITGIANKASLYYAKVLGDNGFGRYDSVASAILWSIVQKIDIIIMSVGGDYDNQILRDVVKKAHAAGICMFSAHGTTGNIKLNQTMFPAKYSEVVSVGFSNKITKVTSLDNTSIVFPNEPLQTLYLNNRYIKIKGSSFYNPLVGGIAARVIQNARRKGDSLSPDYVYKIIRDLAR